MGAGVAVGAGEPDGARVGGERRAVDLFVVPAGTTNSEGMLEYLQHLRAYVRRALPYYNRSAGADHVWFCSGDHCGDALNGAPGLGAGIALAHYFTTRGGGSPARHISLAP